VLLRIKNPETSELDQQASEGTVMVQNVRPFPLRLQLLSGAAFLAAVLPASAAAQDDDIVVVTGTRIQSPNVVSSSPVHSVDAVELEFQHEASIERVLRNLPATIPGDGENVNFGTTGAASINLRGLGTNRSLILINGKRLTPYAMTGIVDTQIIPTQLIERVDVVTGGASAVYGSDAMSGAINFILKDDFEGVEISYGGRLSEQSDGQQHAISILLGDTLNNGRGNVTANLGYTRRYGVTYGARPYGLVGISSTNGTGLDGTPVLPEEANCQGPQSVDDMAAGSTVGIPTALNLPGQALQFRNDGTLGPRCSLFNFNPFNYYQTPQERMNFDLTGRFEISRHFELYGRANFTTTQVTQQIAPSGVFGNVFEIPLMNPFLSAQARQAIIDQVNTFATNASLDPFDPTTGAIDNDLNGVFDLNDSISVPVLRRTLELGTRSESFDADQFHLVFGLRGDFIGDWSYDLSFQHGQSERTRVRSGYTNVTNIALALNTVDANACITPGGVAGPSDCIPLDLFSGGFGSITQEMADYTSVTAQLQETTTQHIVSATVHGPVEALKSPFAYASIDAAFGLEYREETAASLPDDCLQQLPTSCQGGSGNNFLPVSGAYDVLEVFGEAFIPLVEGRPLIEDFNAELGYRLSDYSLTGQAETWKAGVNWSPVERLRFRAMLQQANRAPNISELFSPVTAGLSSATYDPCSAGNPNPIDATLRALCESTGVPSSLVGVVGDIIAGQVSQFGGTQPNALPDPETARTITLGLVWTPSLDIPGLTRTVITVDYYDIEIEDFIGTFSGQEAMDACYVLADPAACAGIVRINGSLTTAGAGLPGYTTNLSFRRAEGIEISARTGWDAGDWGLIDVSLNANHYLTNALQSAPFSAAVDCNGYYGTTCDPVPQLRIAQRTSWTLSDVELSYLLRYMSAMDVQANEAGGLFPAFRSIDAYAYVDLSGSYTLNDNIRFGVTIDNVFDQDPPIVGLSTGTTTFNSGNTFPSLYDVLGRVFTVSATVNF
jgi:outer membrane receptor protein involved in Fe transport